jgi:hypothetical protein
MATFGFDQPDIECLLFARPVKSLRLYKQMIGRGLRTAKNKKKCVIIDCANVIEDNGYPTEDIPLNKKPIVSKLVDAKLSIERESNGEIKSDTITVERREYLTKISSLLDLYANKVYKLEKDLQEDIKKFLKKTNLFYWRQNSGILYVDGRYVHFTDKKGLPDITVLYKTVYVGIELKLPRGSLTKDQIKTLPQIIEKGNNIFFAQSVIDLFDIIEHLNTNIISSANCVTINNNIYILPENQLQYREKYKLPIYSI